MASSGEALSLKWAFGYDKSLPSGAQSLCDATAGRYALFYAAAHTGVIYDCVARTQRLLQGHCNAINAIAVSQDKRFIVTADAGRDSLLVVWDSATGTPVKTLFQVRRRRRRRRRYTALLLLLTNSHHPHTPAAPARRGGRRPERRRHRAGHAVGGGAGRRVGGIGLD